MKHATFASKLGGGIANYINYHPDGESIAEALVIEATGRCDWGLCPCCYKNCTPGGGTDMSLDIAEQIRDVLADVLIDKPKEIWIAGGEPTCNPELRDIADVFGGISKHVALITNGFKLGEDANYARELLKYGGFKEVAITLNSQSSYTHSVLVTPEDGILTDDPFLKAVNGLVQVARIRDEVDGRFIISINLNMSYTEDADGEPSEDLRLLVNDIEARGGLIDKVIFQSMNPNAGRAKEIPADHILREWQTPSVQMVGRYFRQAEELIKNGRLKEAYLIDPLPQPIVNALNLDIHPMYQVAATPCIDEFGNFRIDVLGDLQ